MSDSGAQLTAGSVIGGTYEAMHQIGRGGMGEVWLARHLRLPKQVAIKVLHTRGAPLTEDALLRFRREAEIASRLGHPNIVEVHDFNTLPSGDPYLVLELLEGEPLSRRLKRGTLSIADARAVVRQVGSALQAAHHQGVVHRDLKPDNIYLVPSPLGGLRVKVLDFGISKIQDSTTLQTQEAVLVGTPQYMSPEQATGSNKDVGPQADVFALGAIAYELLSGQAAFKGESVAQLVFRVAYEKHPPLAPLVAADVPATAVAAVEHALLKDRAQRTPDIATLVMEFTGEPITLIMSGAVPPVPQLAVVATPSMVMSASLGVADTAAPSGSQPSLHLPTPAVPQPITATPGVPTVPATPEPHAGLPSSSARPMASSSTSASTPGGMRFRAVWVSAAALALCVAGGYGLTRPDSSQARIVSSEVQPVAAKADEVRPKPPPPPEPPKPVEALPPQDPPPGEPSSGGHAKRPAPPKTEAVAPPEPSPPPSEPTKKKMHRNLSQEEKARVDDLRSAAVTEGRARIDMRTLIHRYELASDGINNQFALDEMVAVVAKAMCHQGDDRYLSWLARIETPRVKRHVEDKCAPQ